MDRARLLVDPPLDGPANMARDEALLQACGESGAVTVRFYAWSPATISLGYFQEYRDYESLPPPAGDLAVVRRTTGGGAILHDLEVTYSIVLPLRHLLVIGHPAHLYELAHEAITDAIGPPAALYGTQGTACGEASSHRGPFFCFERRHALDVVIRGNGTADGQKIAGSAQRRTRTAILQHGSIILDNRFPQHRTATWKGIAGGILFSQAVARLVPAFAVHLGVRFDQGAWTANELAAAAPIEEKYTGKQWTIRRLK